MNIKSIADARRQGFRVKVNHYRFKSQEVQLIRKLAVLDNTHPSDDRHKEQTRLAKKLGIEPLHAASFENGNDISSLGGVTEVVLIKDGTEYLGAAHCSLIDNYERRWGINSALGRALSAVSHKICI